MQDVPENAGIIAPPPLLALGVIVLGLLLDWLLPAYVLTLLLSIVSRVVIGILLIGLDLRLSYSAISHSCRLVLMPRPGSGQLHLLRTEFLGGCEIRCMWAGFFFLLDLPSFSPLIGCWS